MEHAAKIGSWGELYVMLGTSSAALLGLLFVATSLHLNDLLKNPSFGTRALYNNLCLILTLVEAALILVPQPAAALSIELTVANLMMFLFTVRVVYRFLFQERELGKRGGFSDYRSATFLVAFLAGAAGAALLYWRFSIGLYTVTAAYIVVLVTVALNAWSIMLGLGQADRQVE